MLMPIPLKLFHKTETEGAVHKSFNKYLVTLKPKPHKERTQTRITHFSLRTQIKIFSVKLLQTKIKHPMKRLSVMIKQALSLRCREPSTYVNYTCSLYIKTHKIYVFISLLQKRSFTKLLVKDTEIKNTKGLLPPNKGILE